MFTVQSVRFTSTLIQPRYVFDVKTNLIFPEMLGCCCSDRGHEAAMLHN